MMIRALKSEAIFDSFNDDGRKPTAADCMAMFVNPPHITSIGPCISSADHSLELSQIMLACGTTILSAEPLEELMIQYDHWMAQNSTESWLHSLVDVLRNENSPMVVPTR